jgi:S1-C subfamily serine protease
MTVKNLNERDRTDFNTDHGVLITNIKPFGTAEDQRLFAGLVIVEADRKQINDIDEFSAMVESKRGSALLLNVVDNKGNSRFVGLEIPE